MSEENHRIGCCQGLCIIHSHTVFSIRTSKTDDLRHCLCCHYSRSWQLLRWICECIVHQLLTTVAASVAGDWVQDNGASPRAL